MKTLFFTFIIFLFPISASACSYIFQTPEEAYVDNPIVFIGEITNLKSEGGINGSREVTFEVLKNYKEMDQDEITLVTGANSALCGFDEGALEEGQIWLIHTANTENFNSLPANKKFENFDSAVSYADPLAEDPIFCTLEYAPVCGKVDTGIRCITEPCDSFVEKTYSNNCMLETAGAEFLYKGECGFDEAASNAVQEPESDVVEKEEKKGEAEFDSEEKTSFWRKIVNFFSKIFGF